MHSIPLHLQAGQRLSLIGRTGYLQRIQTHLDTLDSPAIYYIEGEGGIGKTELAKEVLKQAQDNEGWVLRDLIDLYHVDYQSPVGLAEGILKLLRPEQPGPDQERFDALFSKYKKDLEQLRRQQRSGVGVESGKPEVEIVTSEVTWDDVWQAFARGLSALAQDMPVLIVLDTVEILEYTRDEFQRKIGVPLSLAFVGDWLFHKLLPQLEGKIFWLLLGRPTELTTQLDALEGINVIQEELHPLSQEESVEYLIKAADLLETTVPEHKGVRDIRDFAQSHPDGLYYGTGGRPILLALIADILGTRARLPSPFYRDVPLVEDERKALAQELLRYLLRLESPVGETLQVLALFRKGVDVQLFIRFMEISKEAVEQYLASVVNLSLVKVRPESKRVYFLHDEIYEMFALFWEVKPEEWQRLGDIALMYYDEEETRVLEQLRQYPGIERREQLEAERRAIQIERIHYALFTDPVQGFEDYFVAAEEALDGRNTELDMLLRTQLLRTLRSLKRVKRINMDLEQRYQADIAVRWGMRKLLLDGDPKEALRLFAIAREDHIETQCFGHVSWHIRLYEAVAKIYQQRFDAAQQKLEELAGELQVVEQPDVKSNKLLTGLVYAYLGYVQRLKPDYPVAISYYHKANKAFEEVGATGMQVSTQSNQAYAMAMDGRYRRAEEVLLAALRLVRQEGSAYWEVQVHNGFVIVHTLNNAPLDALRHGHAALKLLREEVFNQRLSGLVYTNMARAYRDLWNATVLEKTWRADWGETLWPAYQLLENPKESQDPGALSLLRRWSEDSVYYIETLMESGCVQREMAWVYRRLNELGKLVARNTLGDAYETFRKADKSSENRFLQVAGVDVTPNPHQSQSIRTIWEPQVRARIEALKGDRLHPSLALVNLGWHYRYQHLQETFTPWEEFIREICALVERLIPEDYHFPNPKVERKQEGVEVLLWDVLGKIEMLRFDITLQANKETWATLTDLEKDKRIRKAAKYATYSLEYNHLMCEVPYDIKRTEQGFSQRISILSDYKQLLISKLFEYGQQVVDEDFGGRKTHFLQWLEERFGERDLWE